MFVVQVTEIAQHNRNILKQNKIKCNIFVYYKILFIIALNKFYTVFIMVLKKQNIANLESLIAHKKTTFRCLFSFTTICITATFFIQQNSTSITLVPPVI
jgi:hypothetical protein